FSLYHVTSTTDIYTLSLHDALPILNVDGIWMNSRESDFCVKPNCARQCSCSEMYSRERFESEFRSLLLDEMNFVFGETCRHVLIDRKSTRLNSSHVSISYAVFCLKK